MCRKQPPFSALIGPSLLSYGNKSITDTLVNTAFGEGVPEREPLASSWQQRCCWKSASFGMNYSKCDLMNQSYFVAIITLFSGNFSRTKRQEKFR